MKAYVDRTFGDSIKTCTYSAHFSIPYRVARARMYQYFSEVEKTTEVLYLALLYDRFLRAEHQENPLTTSQLLDCFDVTPEAHPQLRPERLSALQLATDRFVEEEILTSLPIGPIHVVGFTINFSQLYSSLYIERVIRQKASGHKLLFLYGGYGASSDISASMLRRFGGSGLRVIGEGERKVEALLRRLLSLETWDGRNEDFGIDGVKPVTFVENQSDGAEKCRSSQLPSLSALPLPDYDEFFDRVARTRKQDPLFALIDSNGLFIEGSRGCFAACDFCSLNAQWRGFRTLQAEQVFARTTALVDRYKVKTVQFLDNVCDTWAERFADLKIKSGFDFRFFMELRAHHPERFWTSLALAGLADGQIGIEALSSPLLTAIGKGTTVIQNLQTQKYLCELGVNSCSNIIGFHPRSTVGDVEETRRVLELTSHFPKLNLVRFRLDAESKIHKELPDGEKRNLVPLSVEIPGGIGRTSVSYGYEMPPSLTLTGSLERAWSEFSRWYNDAYLPEVSREAKVSVTTSSASEIVVEDSRWGARRNIRLAGAAAQVFNHCHKGMKRAQLLRVIPDEVALDRALTRLLGDRLVLSTDDYFLTLGLRPREELIRNVRSRQAAPVNTGLAPLHQTLSPKE